jgi:hypothetical protein
MAPYSSDASNTSASEKRPVSVKLFVFIRYPTATILENLAILIRQLNLRVRFSMVV